MTVAFDRDLLARVDRVGELRAGLHAPRASIVRTLVLRGLEALERDAQPAVATG